MTSHGWNHARSVGERLRLTIAETQAIHMRLVLMGNAFEACLFALGIDTMLRAKDLLSLKVSDVIDASGAARTKLTLKQQKTRFPVYPVLTRQAREACEALVDIDSKKHHDFLFDKKGAGTPISYGWYRRLVKRWVEGIGLDPEHYSTHSLRRTKALYLYYVQRVDIQHISQLLGHKDIPATSHYLRLEISAAQSQALAANIFEASPTADENIKPAPHPLLTPSVLNALSDEIAKRLAPKIIKQLTKKEKDE